MGYKKYNFLDCILESVNSFIYNIYIIKCVIYNGIKDTKQTVYDSYNQFLFSDDNRVFNKMTKRIEIYSYIKDLVGDVVEVGGI